MNMPEFVRKDFDYWGQWKQPVLSCWFWIDWNKTSPLKDLDIYGLETFPVACLDGHFLIHATHRAEFSKMVKRIIQEGAAEEYTATLNSVLVRCEQKYLAVLKESTGDPFLFAQHLFDASRDMAAVWIWAMFMADELAKLVVSEKIVASEAELMSRTHDVTSQTWLEKQSADVNEFAQIIKSLGFSEASRGLLDQHQDLKSKIDSHVKDLSWFGTHHWMGEGYDISKCLQQINEAIKSPQKVEQAVKGSDDEMPIIKLVAAGAYWRTHSAEVTAKVVYEARPVLSTIAATAGLTYDELIYLSGPEVMALTKDSDASQLRKDITERKTNGYGCIVIDDQIQLVTGADLKNIMSELLDLGQEQVKEFKGSVASKGQTVKGIARVILSPDDFHKLKDDEILVAPETTPDYVPLMKKALAIITDVGGITSHAAIVSRELRKPCIIGTRVATRVLSDGDMIEVNTDTGIIKIIS